ncbi:hypothetical protein ACE2AJ_18670 [Aquihabitans daechungensis]|uniref:DUF7507 domain-containing protein n=1 Tax=Aquihabitans daechungensis TaxID=1052257 RepID=UPI003B9E6055
MFILLTWAFRLKRGTEDPPWLVQNREPSYPGRTEECASILRPDWSHWTEGSEAKPAPLVRETFVRELDMSILRRTPSGSAGAARPRGRRFGLAAAVSAVVIAGLAPLASGTPATDGNPDLPAVCGLDVTLVLDDSGSISSTEADQVRQAASSFASALDGTPSRVKVGVFSTLATGVNSGGSLTANLNNIVFRDPGLYTNPTSGSGDGGTNWDDGLEIARRSSGGPGDLVVFITDGDPTYRNEDEPDGHDNNGNGDTDGDGSTVSAANLAAAVYESDAIKDSGAHMFGIGVGLTDAASEQRLNDVTGDEELTLDGLGNPNIPFGTADYTIAPNFTSLQAIVKSFVRELCAPSLNVTKFLQKADGTTAQAGAGDPWTFNASVTPTPNSWQSPVGASGATASQATDGSGGVSFKWKMSDNSATVDLSENPKAGWVYNGALCTRNKLDGNDPEVIFDTVGANSPAAFEDQAELQDLIVGLNEAVNCDVYNRQVRTSTIQVAKQTVPAGLSNTFDFTLSQGPTTIESKTGVAHGGTATFAPVAPGTYAVTEAANSGFTQTSATCDNLGTQAVETVGAGQLVVGEAQSWKCTFVNTANPGTIKVVKNAVGADGAFSFTSNTGLGNFDLTTSGGTASTTATAAAVGTYDIAEGSAAPWQLTSATCTGNQSPASVFVGPGQDVVCTFTNTAPDPSIQVTKSAGVASVAEPGAAVTYTVTVANTSVEPVEITSLTDSVEGGASFPITAVAGPVTATSCGSLIGTTLTVSGPGSSAQCTFTVLVAGNGGDTIDDIVTAKAADSDDNVATDTDDASVAVTSVAPALSVTKTPNVSSIAEPGGPVTYTVKISNDGVEPIVLDAATDAIEGASPFSVATVAAQVTATTCGGLIGSTVPVGGEVTCTFTLGHLVDRSDLPDGDLDDIVKITGHDDDDEVAATANAEVAVTDALPAITVTKTPSPTSVAETAPGQTRPVSYLVTIQNDSAETVTIDSIVDSVEGGAPAAVGGTCAALIGTTLAAQTGTSCTFTMGVAGNAGDSVDDVVTVGASDDDGNEATDFDGASVTITGLASSINVIKTASVGSVPEPGGNVTYTVDIQNTSASDSVTISAITDSVSGGAPVAAGGTCPAKIGTVLAPGASTSCSFTLAVSGNAGDSVPDTVTVSGTDDDGTPVSDSGDEEVGISDVPSSIVVTKTGSVGSVVEPGGNVTYTVTIENTSVSDSVTIDAITDSVSGGAPVAAGGTCPSKIGTVLAPGASTTCSFTLPVTGNAGDAVTDTVEVTGTDDDDGPVDATDSEIVDITDASAAISVVKTPSVSSVPEPGGNVTYTVDITNDSTADTVILDTIVDSVDGAPAVPAGGTCPALIGDSLPPGDSTTCSFTLLVTGNAGDTVPDTVTVTGHDDDPVPDGIAANAVLVASDSAVVDVTDVPPTGTASKTADPATVPEPGGPVVFAVSVTNTSVAEPATVTAITDTVDGNVIDVTTVGGAVTATTCATGAVLAPGTSYTCTFTLLVSGANAGAAVVDQIGITLSDDDGNSVTPTDTETVAVTDVLPTIAVVKDNGGATVAAPGGDVEFDVTVTNTSPDESVTLTELTDTIEGGAPFDITSTDPPVVSTTCATGGVIASGASYSCSFTVAVTSDEAATQADVVDAVAVDDEQNEATAGDDAVTAVTASADLAVDKRLIGELVVGEPGTYELEVSNLGPSAAADVVLVDTLPDGLTAVSATGEGWACEIEGSLITCRLDALAAGESSVVTVVVDVAESTLGTEVVNVADVSSETEDPDDTNNHDEEPSSSTEVIPEVIDNPETTTPTTPYAPTEVAQTASAPLPRTGSDPSPLVSLALCLVAVGGLVLVGRRIRVAGRT